MKIRQTMSSRQGKASRTGADDAEPGHGAAETAGGVKRRNSRRATQRWLPRRFIALHCIAGGRFAWPVQGKQSKKCNAMQCNAMQCNAIKNATDFDIGGVSPMVAFGPGWVPSTREAGRWHPKLMRCPRQCAVAVAGASSGVGPRVAAGHGSPERAV